LSVSPVVEKQFILAEQASDGERERLANDRSIRWYGWAFWLDGDPCRSLQNLAIAKADSQD
jgi:hypothetical protein